MSGKGTITTDNLNNELKNNFNDTKEVFESNELYYYKGYKIDKQGKIGEGKLLPDEYQQVEYIESTGTQYIDTGISGGTNSSYEIHLNNLGTQKVKYEQYFGGMKLSPIPKLFLDTIFNTTDGKGIAGETTYNGEEESIKMGENKDFKYEICYYPNGKMYVNGEEKWEYIHKGDGWGNLSWYVFSSHSENNLKSTMRLYLLKMFNDNNLIRYYIPCYTIKTVTNVNGKQCEIGTKGIYDLVEGKFYTNQGTGKFIVGPEV